MPCVWDKEFVEKNHIFVPVFTTTEISVGKSLQNELFGKMAAIGRMSTHSSKPTLDFFFFFFKACLLSCNWLCVCLANYQMIFLSSSGNQSVSQAVGLMQRDALSLPASISNHKVPFRRATRQGHGYLHLCTTDLLPPTSWQWAGISSVHVAIWWSQIMQVTGPIQKGSRQGYKAQDKVYILQN